MADNDIKIQITTAADTAGIDQTVESIKRVEAEEQTLQQQRDARTRGVKYDDPTAGAAITARKEQIRLTRELEQAEQDLVDKLHMEARAAQQTADVVEAKSRVAARAAGAQAGEIKNLGHVFNNVGYQVTDFAVQVQGGTSALVAMSQQAPQAVGALTMLKGATLSLGSIMSAVLSPLTAVSVIITALAIGGRAVAEAYKGMTAATKEEEKAIRSNAEAKKYMVSQQKELQKEVAREFLSDTYKREADALERQAKAIDRINQLRTEMGNIEQQRANQEIQIAKQREGQTNSQTGQKYDVGVAEANALAVQLRTGIAALNGQLGAAQQGAAQAQQKFDAAYSAYQTAINTHDPKANIDDLAKSVEAAREDAASAKQEFADTTQRITAERGVLLNEVEIKLGEKEADSSVKVTAASTKAFDGVVASLTEAVAQGPVAAVEQIKVEVGTVTTAATTKATEVKTAIDGERTTTVAAIQTLTPNPQDTQAITKAVQDVGKGLSEQGDAFLSALNNLTAGISSINNRINQQQSQINQLFSIAR
jgi:hypothetical protein